MKSYKYLSIISGLFVMTLIVSNVLSAKIFNLFGFVDLPSGILIFPLAYLFGDMLTEVYGYAASRRVIWTGFISLIFFIAFTTLAIHLPPSAGWTLQTDFASIFSHMPRIVIASIVAYFCGEFVNSYIVAKMKVRAKGKGMALRFVLSTIFGEFIDMVLFAIIAFAGVLPFGLLISFGLWAWGFKILWEIIALPATMPLVKRLKRIENEDYFDKNTNFNPLRI
jgi:uncharacterized integral membrane protein (TIGR00697 family)